MDGRCLEERVGRIVRVRLALGTFAVLALFTVFTVAVLNFKTES